MSYATPVLKKFSTGIGNLGGRPRRLTAALRASLSNFASSGGTGVRSFFGGSSTRSPVTIPLRITARTAAAHEQLLIYPNPISALADLASAFTLIASSASNSGTETSTVTGYLIVASTPLFF